MRRSITLTIAFLFYLSSISVTTSLGDTEEEGRSLCGPKCLLAVCQKLGVPANLSELTPMCGKSDGLATGTQEHGGTDMLSLKKVAEAKGLKASGVKLALDKLVRLGEIAIVALWDSHYVVVEPGEEGSVQVTDPPGPPRQVPIGQFSAYYSGLALIISKSDLPGEIPCTKGADLRLGQLICDVGKLKEGTQGKFAIRYRNAGDEDLTFTSTQSSCGCVTVSLLKDSTSPGATGYLHGVIDSTGRTGAIHETVSLMSNDPVTPIVRVSIVGTVEGREVHPVPRLIDFGRVRPQDSPHRDILLCPPGDGTFEITSATASSTSIEVSTPTPGTRPMSSDRILQVNLRPGVPTGRLSAHITIAFKYHDLESSVDIPVEAWIDPVVLVQPECLFFGLVKKGQKANASVTLTVNGVERLGKVMLEHEPGCFTAVVHPGRDTKTCAIKATTKRDTPIGLLRETLVIKTGVARQPEVRIPVLALVRE